MTLNAKPRGVQTLQQQSRIGTCIIAGPEGQSSIFEVKLNSCLLLKQNHLQYSSYVPVENIN
jgi:hypothetical protein